MDAVYNPANPVVYRTHNLLYFRRFDPYPFGSSRDTSHNPAHSGTHFPINAAKKSGKEYIPYQKYGPLLYANEVL